MFINPQESFEQMVGGNNNIKMSLRAYLRNVFNSNAITLNPSFAKYESNKLIIKIDFSNIRNITDTINLINDTIKLEYQYYQDHNECYSINKTDFDIIYQVGILKEGKYSSGKIAQIVFPGDPIDSAKSKIKQHHDRYMELITGGWRKIKFP